MKAQVMFALYSSHKGSTVPLGIFSSRWKAKEAYGACWNMRQPPRIERVWVERPADNSFTITAHAYRRVSPQDIGELATEFP